MIYRTPDSKNFDILLVEDTLEDMDLYVRSLKKKENLNFNIEKATTIKQAIEISEKQKFDCYVVDYHLPDGDGIKFIHHLIDNKNHHKDSAIVMVTGQGDEETAVEALKVGADDYLTKKAISDGIFVQPLLAAIDRARLKSQIAHYQEELERSNNELADFAHTASHDLKSPLRRIKSYCDILEEDSRERLNTEDKQILFRIDTNINRMQSLIEQLLTFSLINNQKEEKEDIDINQLLLEITNDFEPQIKEACGQINCNNMPCVYGYKTRLIQLFSNLISNALKYKNPGINALIQVGVEDTQTHYRFFIKDNGLGISKDNLDKIFTDFKRLHAHEDIEGSGLGLSICKKIVEKHNGKLWVESTQGEGSTFHFTIIK